MRRSEPPGCDVTAMIRHLEALSEAQIRELHALYQAEWWSAGRTLDEVRTLLRHSDVIVALAEADSGRLAAFARVLTDRVCKALVLDVIVAPDCRGQGLGRRLMAALLAHPAVAGVRHVELYCRPGMAAFYARWGFRAAAGELLFLRREDAA